MIQSLPKIWTLGAAVIAAAQIGWFLLLGTQTFSQVAVMLLWASSGIAAFIVSYLSPRWKIVMGLSMIVPAAVLVTVLNYGYQLTGHASDFPGLRGAAALFTVALAWNAVVCGIGTAAGYVVAYAVRR